MDWQTLYETEKKKREAAEARVTELQGIVRASREDEHLVDVLRSAGVPQSAAKDAAAVMRRDASITFEDDGTVSHGELDGRTYYEPTELVRAFVKKWPNFTAEHIEAVERERGIERPDASNKSGVAEEFTAPGEEWKNLPPGEMADLAWSKPAPPPPAAPDPFAHVFEGRD